MSAEGRRKAVWRKVFDDCDPADFRQQGRLRQRPRCETIAALARHYGCQAETFEQWRRESRMFRGATDGLLCVPNIAHCYAHETIAPAPYTEPPTPRVGRPRKHRDPVAPPTTKPRATREDRVAAIAGLPGTYASVGAIAKALGLSRDQLRRDVYSDAVRVKLGAEAPKTKATPKAPRKATPVTEYVAQVAALRGDFRSARAMCIALDAGEGRRWQNRYQNYAEVRAAIDARVGAPALIDRSVSRDAVTTEMREPQ